MSISQFLQAPPNVLIFRHAPVWLAKRYLHMLGKLYYIANRKERKVIEQNISTVFNDPVVVKKIVNKTFQGIFEHYTEKLLMAYRNLDTLKSEVGEVLEFTGLEHLDEARRKGGVIMVTGHFGAVEFMPMALNLRQCPVSMVVTFQTEKLKESLVKRAIENDIELIDGGGCDLIRRQIKALKTGRVLLTECDEVDVWNIREHKTIAAFGSKISVDRTIAFLARLTGAQVLGAFILRTEKGYRFMIEPIGMADNVEEGLSEQIMKTLERVVMNAPEQWYQWKKLHKMRPEVA